MKAHSNYGRMPQRGRRNKQGGSFENSKLDIVETHNGSIRDENPGVTSQNDKKTGKQGKPQRKINNKIVLHIVAVRCK